MCLVLLHGVRCGFSLRNKNIKKKKERRQVKVIQSANMPDNDLKSPCGEGDQHETMSFNSKMPAIDLKSSNLAMAWKNWLTQFKIFLRATNLEQGDSQRKVALLLHHMGSEALEIFHSFNVDLDSVTYDDLVEKFNTHFLPKVNLVMERHKFFTRMQLEGETIDEYMTVLKNLSLTCEFKTLREELVRDIFVCGLSSKWSKIKERLLGEDKLTLNNTVIISKNMVTAQESASQLQNEVHVSSEINMLRKRTVNSCFRCGKNHGPKCPAWGVTCHNCKKPNHFAVMCKSPKSFQSQPQFKNSSQSYIKNINEEQQQDNSVINLLQKNKPSTCGNCGEIHRSRCPAIGVICHICKQVNHYAKMCIH